MRLLAHGGIFPRCAELGRAIAYFEIAPTLGLKPQASTNLHITSLNPVPNAQVCVHLTIHITKLQLQTIVPKPLYI